MNPPYHLEKYNSRNRFTCPSCGQPREFTRYVWADTGEPIGEGVGRCNRENSCGYHLTPAEHLKKGPERGKRHIPNTNPVPAAALELQFLPDSVLEQSTAVFRKSCLWPHLVRWFGKTVAADVAERYFLGASKNGFTAFWRVDSQLRAREVKVIRYQADGHRDKSTPPYFAGKKILRDQEVNLKQCFFGEHLLALHPFSDVAIVESEKTALVCSVYFPGFIWLSTGGKTGVKWTEAAVCRVLRGRSITLFPDLGAYDSWVNRAELFRNVSGCSSVKVSSILEKEAEPDQRKAGLDLADFLLHKNDSSGLALTDEGYPIIFDYPLLNTKPCVETKNN